MKESNFGVVFDIDGVLLKDGAPIQGATTVLKRLHDERSGVPLYPYVFVTNGGGFSEADKAKKVGNALDFNIEEDRVMVAHTPMKELADLYKNDRIIAVSRRHETAVKLSTLYGFKQFTSIQEYVEKRPFLYPAKYSKFWTMGVKNDYKLDEDQEKEKEMIYKAIILFEEPSDWGETLQVLSDVLQTQDGLIHINQINKTSRQTIDVHVANPDYSYGGEFILPRYTMGAFIQCLSTLYKSSTGNDLNLTYYGKPYITTYKYAKELMDNQVKKMNQLPPKHIYAIGDNPLSDIKGANQLESEGWISILVRTGVFQGSDNDHDNPAKYVVNNVVDALDLIIRLESTEK